MHKLDSSKRNCCRVSVKQVTVKVHGSLVVVLFFLVYFFLIILGWGWGYLKYKKGRIYKFINSIDIAIVITYQSRNI